jgi:cytochrome c
MVFAKRNTMKAFAIAAVLLVTACSGGQPAADASHPGRAVFQQQCGLCHSVDGSRSQGPSLQGVYGRPAGSLAGFAYTKALKESGLTWDQATLDAFLDNPMAKVPGSMMVTSLKDPAQRAAVIGYLQTLKAP